MEWNFLLNHEEFFIKFNTNILETNLINILLLIGLLLYANKVSFSSTLEGRQKEIIQAIENAQKDVVHASNYYYLAEKGFMQSLVCLQAWKILYEKEKIELIESNYNKIKILLVENFVLTETLAKNSKQKSFFSLQRYIILITVSKILRKFFLLTEKEQLKIIELTILKLGRLQK